MLTGYIFTVFQSFHLVVNFDGSPHHPSTLLKYRLECVSPNRARSTARHSVHPCADPSLSQSSAYFTVPRVNFVRS